MLSGIEGDPWGCPVQGQELDFMGPSDSGYCMILCFLQWMGMFSRGHAVTLIVSLSLKLFVNNGEVVSLPCVTVPRHSCLIPGLFLSDL